MIFLFFFVCDLCDCEIEKLVNIFSTHSLLSSLMIVVFRISFDRPSFAVWKKSFPFKYLKRHHESRICFVEEKWQTKNACRFFNKINFVISFFDIRWKYLSRYNIGESESDVLLLFLLSLQQKNLAKAYVPWSKVSTAQAREKQHKIKFITFPCPSQHLSRHLFTYFSLSVNCFAIVWSFFSFFFLLRQ